MYAADTFNIFFFHFKGLCILANYAGHVLSIWVVAYTFAYRPYKAIKVMMLTVKLQRLLRIQQKAAAEFQVPRKMSIVPLSVSLMIKATSKKI